MIEKISAAEFKRMFISASAAIDNNKQKLNDLNVFPVPDGDTGTNMSLTARAGATAIEAANPATVGEAADIVAKALLRGARGNSGVILSLLFRGFAKSCAKEEYLSAKALAEALAGGVEAAYRAVMKPAEGTILSVSRKASERAKEVAKKTADLDVIFKEIISAASVALDETTDLNPVLKKAGVVDAGGCGWLMVLEGMYAALLGNDVKLLDQGAATSSASLAVADEEIVFAYCTEFIINLNSDGKLREVSALREYLESIGDCVVVVDDDDIIKVHVHTNQPDKALNRALKYGELTNLKIDNMRYQHTEKVVADGERADASPVDAIAPAETKYGFAVVGAGEGILTAFRDLGANTLVEGGQTMNPSTEDILAAVNATPSEIVFVLPNNKNIIMAAQATAELTEKQVVVVGTKTVPQGISAMLAFDPDASVEENLSAMEDAAKNVSTGSITYAARDSDFDGHSIKEGEYLALCEGKLSASGKDLDAVVNTLLFDMAIEDKSVITVFYGEGVKEEDAGAVENICREKCPDGDVMLLDGGQPVYYYLISAE